MSHLLSTATGDCFLFLYRTDDPFGWHLRSDKSLLQVRTEGFLKSDCISLNLSSHNVKKIMSWCDSTNSKLSPGWQQKIHLIREKYQIKQLKFKKWAIFPGLEIQIT